MIDQFGSIVGIQEQVLIISPGMLQESPPWATHYRFFDFPECRTYYIPKEGLSTWHDLKNELDDHLHIDYRFMQIVVNRKMVHFSDDTLLEDVDLRQSDECIVLVKRKFDREKEGKELAEYDQKREEAISFNRLQISEKCNQPDNRAVIATIKASSHNQQIYDRLLKEYSKWHILAAFQHCNHREPQLREYLSSGKAKKAVEERARLQEIREINEFLKKEDVQEIKRVILDNTKDPNIYAALMRKLFEKYPPFRALQINHQDYVQRMLLGRELYPSANPPLSALQLAVKDLLEHVQRKKKPAVVAPAEVEVFRREQVLKGRTEKEVDEAVAAAGNCLPLARAYLAVRVDTTRNVTMCLKKAGRLNLILQFFTHPTFEAILPRLRHNRPKCEAFLEHVIAANKTNTLLCTLIKKYRLHVITVLTGIYALQKEKDLENRGLQFTEQLSPQQEAAETQAALQALNGPLVEELTKKGVEEGLAVAAVRAASNQAAKALPFLWLGAINRKYDFCNPTRDNEQIYLEKHLRKEKDLLEALRTKQACTLWLASLSETAPLLFKMAIRNKPFLDRLIEGRSK